MPSWTDAINYALCSFRRSWCTSCNGDLLHFIVDTLTFQLEKYTADSPHPLKEDLEHMLEQCFYCLYGHPNKRGKAKHLEDHNAAEVSLVFRVVHNAYQTQYVFKSKYTCGAVVSVRDSHAIDPSLSPVQLVVASL